MSKIIPLSYELTFCSSVYEKNCSYYSWVKCPLWNWSCSFSAELSTVYENIVALSSAE